MTGILIILCILVLIPGINVTVYMAVARRTGCPVWLWISGIVLILMLLLWLNKNPQTTIA